MLSIDITRFKLRNETLEEFVNVNKTDMDEWLKKQEGFQSRHIFETSDGNAPYPGISMKLDRV